MRNDKSLAVELTVALFKARQHMDAAGFTAISLKIVALMDGIPLEKMGITGVDDPANLRIKDDDNGESFDAAVGLSDDNSR